MAVRLVPPILVASLLLLAAPAVAKNPCDDPAAREQLRDQMRALDQQRHAIEAQYRGPANRVARENALAQLRAQHEALEAQKRSLDRAREECKREHRHRKHHGPHDRY